MEPEVVVGASRRGPGKLTFLRTRGKLFVNLLFESQGETEQSLHEPRWKGQADLPDGVEDPGK